jgi:hypothetical protein
MKCGDSRDLSWIRNLELRELLGELIQHSCGGDRSILWHQDLHEMTLEQATVVNDAHPGAEDEG